MALEAVEARSERAARAGTQKWNAVVSASPALLHGLRLTTSVCLALFIAYWLQLEQAHWAGTSASIVAQPALGASVRKGQFRGIGTIAGGTFIVLITAIFPQDHAGFLLCLTLWAAVCGFLAAILRNFAGYGAALAGYTAAIVFAGIIENPQDVFMVSVWRVTEICIGIFSAVVVHSLTDFGAARMHLAHALSELGRAIASGIVKTLEVGQEDRQMKSSRRALIGRVIALDPTIDEALGEPSHMRHHGGDLRAVLEALFRALSAWRGIANHLGAMPAQRRAELVPVLLPSISPVADRVWLNDPAAIRELCATGSRRTEKMTAPDISSRVLVNGLVQILRAFETVASGLLVVTTSSTKRSSRSSAGVHVPDPLPGMLDALRIVLAVGAVELFWVATAWPHAPTMIIFTAMGVILFGRQADAAYSSALEFAIGCVLATIVANIMLLAILPAIHGGFFALSLALAAVLLPLGALSAGSWHKTLFVAAVTNFIPVLGIENETDYDATRLLNVSVAVVAGAALAVFCFLLLPPLSPERRTKRLLMLTLSDLRGLLRGRRRFSEDSWLGLLSQRLAAMPKEAALEEEAELLATLSVGQASIALRAAPAATLTERETLDRALALLAETNVAAAHDGLVRFATAQGERQAAEGRRGFDAAAEATVIADALRRHGPFFAREG
jgi:uncharacterized membrane protein YccC